MQHVFQWTVVLTTGWSTLIFSLEELSPGESSLLTQVDGVQPSSNILFVWALTPGHLGGPASGARRIEIPLKPQKLFSLNACSRILPPL